MLIVSEHNLVIRVKLLPLFILDWVTFAPILVKRSPYLNACISTEECVISQAETFRVIALWTSQIKMQLEQNWTKFSAKFAFILPGSGKVILRVLQTWAWLIGVRWPMMEKFCILGVLGLHFNCDFLVVHFTVCYYKIQKRLLNV